MVLFIFDIFVWKYIWCATYCNIFISNLSRRSKLPPSGPSQRGCCVCARELLCQQWHAMRSPFRTIHTKSGEASECESYTQIHGYIACAIWLHYDDTSIRNEIHQTHWLQPFFSLAPRLSLLLLAICFSIATLCYLVLCALTCGKFMYTVLIRRNYELPISLVDFRFV